MTSQNDLRRRSILFVIDQLCECGGAERVLLNMIRRLPRDRFTPHLLTFRIDTAVFNDLPCEFHLFPVRRTWDLEAAKVAWKIHGLVRCNNIDIVHTFFETSDLWAGPIAKLSGARVLISSRRDMGILRSAKHRFAYRLVNSIYDQVQTVSEQVREYCIRHDRLAGDKVVTLYNGVSLETEAEASASAAFDLIPELRAGSHLISTTAHIRYVKGIDVLLHSAARVRRIFPRVVFVVMGDNHHPAYYEELMRLRRELDLEATVLFPGPVANVFPLLKASTAFLLPSRSEGLSNALLEAMACGIPCVATRVGGNTELVRDGVNGHLVPVGDPDATAAAILTILRDPALGVQMGRAGRRLVEERFTTGAMMQQLVRSYERLLEQHAA